MERPSKIIKKDDVDAAVGLDARLDMQDGVAKLTSDKKVLSADDLAAIEQGNTILKKAALEAQEIKEKARELYRQVGAKMEEAKKQGYEQGRQEGLASVTELLAQIKKQNHDLYAKIEKEAVELVYEIAQKVIGNALKSSDEAMIGMLRQALQSSLGNELILFVHPTDLARVKEHEAQLLGGLQGLQTVQLRASENVKPGGCLVESELGTIDAQWEYQLQAIKRALNLS